MKRQIALGFGLTAALSLGFALLPQPIQAQINDDPQSRDAYPTNERDALTGGSFNALDLIHRANLINRKSGADFQNETNRSLDDASAEFRRLQLERFNNPNSEVTTEGEL